MDPEALLSRVLIQLNDGELAAAKAALAEYRAWRALGGSEPTMGPEPGIPGDDYAARLSFLLRTAETSRTAEPQFCKCRIQWIDHNCRNTADDHHAVGRARSLGSYWWNRHRGEIHHTPPSEWFPICAQHALLVLDRDPMTWIVAPLERPQA